MEKELKKGDVCVKFTDKNRKNVKAILEMFGEKVYNTDTLVCYKFIVFGGFIHFSWWGKDFRDKVRIKPKKLKAILAKENLKVGDYIVLDNGNEIVKIKSISDGKIYVDKHRTKQSDIIFTDREVSIRDFDRYATKEEIKLLECLKINGWYEDCTLPNWLAYYDFTSNKRYGFTVNGSWFRDSNLDFFDKNNITACEKKVEESLIKEAKKRGIVEGALTNNTAIVGFKVLNRQSLNIEKYVFDSEKNTLVTCHNNSELLYPIFKGGNWAEVVDKFSDLKEAHKNGATIEFKDSYGRWYYTRYPSWVYNKEYRIKPEEPIKVGDVCKLWDGDGSFYEVGSVLSTDGCSLPYQSTSGWWYSNAKKVTKEEAIDLLFNKK